MVFVQHRFGFTKLFSGCSDASSITTYLCSTILLSLNSNAFISRRFRAVNTLS